LSSRIAASEAADRSSSEKKVMTVEVAVVGGRVGVDVGYVLLGVNDGIRGKTTHLIANLSGDTIKFGANHGNLIDMAGAGRMQPRHAAEYRSVCGPCARE
jgi:hypothetical protein